VKSGNILQTWTKVMNFPPACQYIQCSGRFVATMWLPIVVWDTFLWCYANCW